jgi:hypothetical protein
MIPNNNSQQTSTSKSKLFLMFFIGLLVAAVFSFLIFSEFFNSKSEFDIVDQENDKIIGMFEQQIQYQIDQHTHGTMNPGYITGSRQQTINYLATITSIESYARYGVTSTQSRNYKELKITFNNGTISDKIYSGLTCSGYFTPCLLLKVMLKNGKTTKVYTNGSEKLGSPDAIINDLNTLIDRAISFDISRNHDSYFPKEKTQQDFDAEWKNK